MRLIDLDPYWAKLPTLCGAAVGAVGTALSFLSEIAMQALGVPLPVVMAAAAGAGLARALGEQVNFVHAVIVTSVWTVLGCVCAPFAQAIIPTVAAMVPGTQPVTLPANALAGVAALVSSSPLWWPKVWPLIRDRLPGGGGRA